LLDLQGLSHFSKYGSFHASTPVYDFLLTSVDAYWRIFDLFFKSWVLLTKPHSHVLRHAVGISFAEP